MNAVSNASDELGQQFIARWESADPDAFANMFSDNGGYVDTAFGLLRRGRDFMRNHHRLWHRACLLSAKEYSTARVSAAASSSQRVSASVPVLSIDEYGKIVRATDYYDRYLMPEGHKAPMRDLDEV